MEQYFYDEVSSYIIEEGFSGCLNATINNLYSGKEEYLSNKLDFNEEFEMENEENIPFRNLLPANFEGEVEVVIVPEFFGTFAIYIRGMVNGVLVYHLLPKDDWKELYEWACKNALSGIGSSSNLRAMFSQQKKALGWGYNTPFCQEWEKHRKEMINLPSCNIHSVKSAIIDIISELSGGKAELVDFTERKVVISVLNNYFTLYYRVFSFREGVYYINIPEVHPFRYGLTREITRVVNILHSRYWEAVNLHWMNEDKYPFPDKEFFFRELCTLDDEDLPSSIKKDVEWANKIEAVNPLILASNRWLLEEDSEKLCFAVR